MKGQTRPARPALLDRNIQPTRTTGIDRTEAGQVEDRTLLTDRERKFHRAEKIGFVRRIRRPDLQTDFLQYGFFGIQASITLADGDRERIPWARTANA